MDDSELVARIQQGDDRAFETLFRQYYEPLVAFAQFHTRSADAARDAVCDVFALLYQRRTAWTVTSTVRGYLFRAVRNQVLHQQRNSSREEARYSALHDEGSEALLAQQPAAPDDVLIALEDQSQLHAVMRGLVEALPFQARTILALRIHQRLSYDEIAETLETTPAAVKMQLSRTLRALRERFPQHLR